MAKMACDIKGITEIGFEDNVFVTTRLGPDWKKPVEKYIEDRGGIMRRSVTESTDYLIFDDGEEETAQFKKALELNRDKECDIKVLSLSCFVALCCGEGIMEFGSFPFEKDGTKKPIRWIVLKREKERTLLLSCYGLIIKPYSVSYKHYVTWETCTPREWLNGEFLDTAFTEEEKRRICPTDVKDEKDPCKKGTEDRIFLLSPDEAESYMDDDLLRMKKLTPFANKDGLFPYGLCHWWLRSSGEEPCFAALVWFEGGINKEVDYIVERQGGICPAMWIDQGPDNTM